MELQFIERGFDYARKRKKWLFLLAAIGFTGCGAFKIYQLPSITRERKRLLKLLGALISVSEAVSESAEAVGVVSRDMKEFLQSDSDQLPNSLKQISKITRSREFSDSLVNVTQALTLGVLRSYQSMNSTDHNQTSNSSSLVDRLVDRLFTPAGSGFVSVVVGSFARNLVLGYSNGHSGGESNSTPSNTIRARHLSSSNLESETLPTWVDTVCSDKCRDVIGNCVQLFVSTAVTVYLDETMHINPYDDFFSGLTNPKHEIKVRDMVVSVCNNAIETLVKTSHQVLTSSDSTTNSSSTAYVPIEEGSASPARDENLDEETASVELKEDSDEEEEESGWIGKVSSTLAVPSNRRLILDVTGRVTFETVRSFMEFMLEKFCACIIRFADVVRETMVEIVRYVAAKSAVIITICLSLCLHLMGGAWSLTLAPA